MTTKANGPMIVATFTTRNYGGPEEGGWWYDRTDLLAARAPKRPSKDRRAIRVMKQKFGWMGDDRPLHSVLSDGQVRVCKVSREEFEWLLEPKELPHYE